MVMDSELSGHGSLTPSDLRLSVVIRVRNEAKNLKRIFEALQAQRCSFNWEVLIVDNESEDETLELCRQYRARVIPIRREEFTYGRALNLGISQARGELILLLSAHSLPVGSYFLESVVAPFADPLMAAVRCLRADSDQMREWYKPQDIRYESPEQQRAAETGMAWTALYPAANGCVIRRSVWEQVKYDEELESNEDKLWASRVLGKGYKIRSCAEAVFVYTRQRRKLDEWRRHNLDHRALYRYSGYVPLSWSRFFLRITRAVILSPLVALRYVAETVIWNTYLVTIPWQAKTPPRAGSLSEFDKHK